MNRRLPKAVLCGFILSALLADSAADAQERIRPLADVEPGQRGYGLSVFAGSQPERFEVEILGTWSNVRPDASYLLARLTGRGLEQSGVIAGMSGSPVYLDGELAGAVAFAWPFSNEAIAGITPIETMRDLMGLMPAAQAAPRGAPPFTLSEIASGRLDAAALDRGLARLRPSLTEGAVNGLQWIAVGFAEATRGVLGRGVGSIAPAGSSDSAGAGDLVPGGSVAGLLVDGDLRLAATGTVTERIDDRLLAFGHGFLGLGGTRFPMASAEVVTVLSNQLSSFKIANLGPVVGAFDLDHQAGIRGQLGAVAPLIPVSIELAGEPLRKLSMRVADIPQVTPSLVAISLLGSIQASPQASQLQAIDLAATFDLGENGKLETRQSFDGRSAATEAALHLLAYTGFLLQNSLQEVDLAGVEVSLDGNVEPRLATLVGAHASRTKVRPGETVVLNVDLAAYRGERFRRSMILEVPTGLPEGRYSLLVGDGVSIDAARLAIEKPTPQTLSQALDLLGSLHSRRELAVLGVFAGEGLSVGGEVMPQLPGSVRSLWGAAASGSAVPLRLAVAQQQVLELEVPLSGITRIDLELERRGPRAEGEGDDSNSS